MRWLSIPRIRHTVRRPPWRTIASAAVLLGAGGLAYLIWDPGLTVTDGRHDRGTNGIYLQHGWLGDDAWFARNDKRDRIDDFRSADRIRDLAGRLGGHGITDVYPHLCPTLSHGRIPPVDDAQVERFLDAFDGFRVMPWVGGVRGQHVFADDIGWRESFATSIRDLFERHDRLAGIHVNIEPCPSGSEDFLLTLDEVRAILPPGKVLSVAAYPPPTVWQPDAAVHWDRSYYREVARRSDQLVVMMYDTGIRFQKAYRRLMAAWTREVIAWSGDTPALFALPAYDDADVGYHHPHVENLRNALFGVHVGLASHGGSLPPNYQGVALYAEWEMDEREWATFRERFLRRDGAGAASVGERP